jgi:hypothetical protein
MTHTGKRAKITIEPRHGHLTTRVRYRALDLDGLTAMILTVIILTARFSWRFLVIADKVTAWACWRVIMAARIVGPVIARVTVIMVCGLVHRSRGMIRALRAFYPL